MGNPLEKIGSFLTEVREEMKKVSWPTWQETWNKSLTVIGISVITAIFLGGLDALFDWMIRKII